MKIIGKGGYSIVYEKNKKEVIKKVRKSQNISFLNSVIELNMIIDTYLHPYIVECKNYKILSDKKDDIIFCFEKSDMDLHTVIHEKFEMFNYKDLKIWMMQILISLNYLHEKKNIIHRDIKPENILIFLNDPQYQKVAKLTDFGISTNYSKQCKFNTNVCTSLYRSPELSLNDRNYDYKIDIWSLGAVFFEMITRRRYLNINNIGDDEEIIKYIFEFHYEMNEKMLEIGEKLKISNEILNKERISIESMLSKIILKDKFEKETGNKLSEFSNLLENMLKFDKNNRFNSSECLNHSFFSSFKVHIQKMNSLVLETARDKRMFIKYDKNRETMGEIIFYLFVKRNKIDWYKNDGYYEHRIIFQAIDIFDRYNMILSRKDKMKNMSDQKIKEIVLVIIYLCMKYFLFLRKEYSFEYVADTLDIKMNKKEKIKCEKIEKKLIKNLMKEDIIYRDTVYDVYDQNMSEIDLNFILLLLLKNKSISGLTPEEFADLYKDHKDKITMENITDYIL